MERDKIKAIIKQILFEEFGIFLSEMTEYCCFADLEMDSLAHEEMIMEMEKKFNITIREELLTVGETIDCIVKNLTKL